MRELGLLWFILLASVLATASLAERNPGKKANKHQVSLVQAVEVCTAPNTQEPSILALASCDPVVPSDPGCTFGAKGNGRIKAKARTDIALQVKVKGIDVSCEGETLCLTADFTMSSDNCASTGDCTSAYQDDFDTENVCCTVIGGQCQTKTTLNAAVPGLVTIGNRTELSLGELGLYRAVLPPSQPAFKSGLLIP